MQNKQKDNKKMERQTRYDRQLIDKLIDIRQKGNMGRKIGNWGDQHIKYS